jgi:hypothetical protein
MNIAIGLLGYALLVIAAGMVDIKLGIAVAGVLCVYVAYANQPVPK